MEYRFDAVIEIIGANPFVGVPEDILEELFKQAGKDKSPIPVKGTLNKSPYQQTLVKFKGLWRLYINTTMLKNSPTRVGETITLTITFDPDERTIQPHPKLLEALKSNNEAKQIFDGLPPSKQHEIIRYLSFLKSEESIDRNVKRAIDFLLGNARFVGRDSP
jgi:hypothetical protein